MLKDFTPRIYQETILNTAMLKNTLVILPTGLGKTAIALLLAEVRLRQYPNSKIIIFAPTKPLCEQHKETFEKYMPNAKAALFTGAISPQKRIELFSQVQIIFSTPQGFENDILGDKLNFKDVSLVVFDEAHRAVGDYAYVFLAKQYDKQADHARILALTASPGSDIEKINEIIEHLFIEEIEIRTDTDEDVKQYVQKTDVIWVKVDLPQDFLEIKKYLELSFKSKLLAIKEKNKNINISQLSKKDLLGMQAEILKNMNQGERDFDSLKILSLLAEALKVYHAEELLETQGINSLFEYLKKLKQDSLYSKVQATKNLFLDANFKSAYVKTETAYENKLVHPKLTKLKDIVGEFSSKNKSGKIIVFSQFRETANELTNELNALADVTATLFVGQAKKNNTGTSQKEQKKIIEDFKQNKFNVLVATSVAEEGLDIPQVELVIFFEPIPSAIRHIQRRGRTGRLDEGRVLILMAKDTRDEHYRWSAFRKERKMKTYINELRTKILLTNKRKEKTLVDFMDEKTSKENNDPVELKIIVDHREKGSPVLKELIDLDVKLDIAQLNIGDFLLSDRVCVEYKTVFDFVDSLIDGRLLIQLKEINNKFARPIVVIEGMEDLYSVRKVHSNAISGMLATIAVSYGIPIIRTKNYRETAGIFLAIAKREQEEKRTNFTLHEKKPLTDKEIQEYVVSSFPGIGSTLAKPLLIKFKSIKNIINLDVEDLKSIDKIGEKKAKRIKELIEKEYVE